MGGALSDSHLDEEWQALQRRDLAAYLPKADLALLAESLTKAAIGDRAVGKAMSYTRLQPEGNSVMLKAVCNCCGSALAPKRRRDRGEGRDLLQDWRRGRWDDWALTSLFASADLPLDAQRKGLTKWRRWLEDALKAGDAKVRGKQGPKRQLSCQDELAALLLSGAAPQLEGGVDSVLSQDVVEELVRDVSYVAVLDASAANELGHPHALGRLRHLAAQQADERRGVDDDPQQVRVALSIDTLQRADEKARLAWLQTYCEPACGWLWLLPLGAAYDIATDPWRPRKRQRHAGPQPPNLDRDKERAMVLAERLDFAAGRLDNPGQYRVFLVSADPSVVADARKRKVLSCCPRELTHGAHAVRQSGAKPA